MGSQAGFLRKVHETFNIVSLGVGWGLLAADGGKVRNGWRCDPSPCRRPFQTLVTGQ